MKKTGIFIFIAALLITGQTCADKGAIMYDQSLAKWNKESVRSYYLKVNYRAFSPQQGLWELEVKDGLVVRASFNGTWDEKFVEPAKRFTVDSIYQRAEAVKSGKTDRLMITSAEFTESVPYIKSVTRNNNEKFTGNMKKDTGFSIIIMEFRK